MNQSAYDVNFNTPNNKLNAKKLLDYIWCHYSGMSVALSGMILVMLVVRVCVGKTGLTKRKDMCVETR